MRVLAELTEVVAPHQRKEPGLLEMLSQPKQAVHNLQASISWHSIPWKSWLEMSAVAFAGTAFFALSLSANGLLGTPDNTGAALWLLLSAGIPWPLLGAFVVWILQVPWKAAVQACLVSMVFGEAVLVAGAIANFLLVLSGLADGFLWPLFWGNIALVLAANILMATTFTSLLEEVGVRRWQAFVGWVLVLNGSGLAFAWTLGFLLKGGVA